MRVGVEKKLFLHLSVHYPYELACQRLWLDTLTAYLGQEFLVVGVDRCQELPHPHARDELAHHHFFGAVLEIDPRRRNALLSLGRAPPKYVGIARLGAEVHLVKKNGLEVFSEPSRNARRYEG